MSFIGTSFHIWKDPLAFVSLSGTLSTVSLQLFFVFSVQQGLRFLRYPTRPTQKTDVSAKPAKAHIKRRLLNKGF